MLNQAGNEVKQLILLLNFEGNFKGEDNLSEPPREAITAAATPPAIETLLPRASRKFEEELLTSVGGGGLLPSSTVKLGEGTV